MLFRSVAEAQIDVTKQANTAIDFVKGQGIAEKDVTTLSYNIYPQYSYTRCITPQVISADSATASIVPRRRERKS